MTRKHRTILQASKNLLSTDLTNWPIVEEIIGSVYEDGKAEGIRMTRNGRSRAVSQNTLDGIFIERFDSAADVAFSLGINKGSIWKNLTGHTSNCKGFQFKYIENENAKGKTNQG